MTTEKRKVGQPPKASNMKKNPISLKLPQWLLEWMDQQPISRAKLIEEALIEKHFLIPPEPNDN